MGAPFAWVTLLVSGPVVLFAVLGPENAATRVVRFVMHKLWSQDKLARTLHPLKCPQSTQVHCWFTAS